MPERKQEWDKTLHDFGVVSHSKSYNCRFVYLGDKKISKLSMSCGCTTVQRKGGIIDATIKFKKGNYNTIKSISVHSEDKSFHKLRMKATVR